MTQDRILTPLRELVRGEVSRLAYLATWEYTVNGTNGDGTINCSSPSAPLPTLNNVPVRSGPEGGTSAPTSGNKCDVRFINGDPRRPVVVGNGPLVMTATIDATDTVAIGASVTNAVVMAGGTAPAAGMGDGCQIYFPTTPMAVVGTVTAPGPTPLGTFVGTVVVTSAAVGTIITGQPKVLV